MEINNSTSSTIAVLDETMGTYVCLLHPCATALWGGLLEAQNGKPTSTQENAPTDHQSVEVCVSLYFNDGIMCQLGPSNLS